MRLLIAVAVVMALGGCADKQCKTDLDACSAKNQQTQKELETAKTESAALKTKAAKMDELIAQLAAVTSENEKLKAAAAAPPAAPTKAGKK